MTCGVYTSLFMRSIPDSRFPFLVMRLNTRRPFEAEPHQLKSFAEETKSA